MEQAKMNEQEFRAKSRRKRSLLNTFLALFGELLIVIAGIFLPKAIIANFNSETNGLVTSVQQVLGYLTLFESGIYGAALVALYKPMAENDVEKINRICTSASKFYNKIGLLYIVFVLGLAVVYPLIANQSTYSFIELFSLVLVVSLNCLTQVFLGSRFKVALMASQKNGLVSLIRSSCMALYYAIVIVAAYLGASIYLAYGLGAIAFALRGLLFYVACKKTMPQLSFHSKGEKFKFTQSFEVMLQHILSMIVLNITVLVMLIMKTSMNVVSVFTVYNMILSGLYLVMDAVNNSVLTSFGNLIAEHREKAISVYREFETVFQIFWSVVIACLASLLIPFIQIYTRGADFDYVDMPLAIGCILMCALWMIRCQQTIALSAAGEYRKMRYGAIIEAVIVIAGSFVGYLLYGVAGSVFGKCVGLAFRVVELVFNNGSKKFLDSTLYTFKKIGISLIALTISVSSSYLLLKALSIKSSWLGWIIMALLSGAIALVVTLFIFLLLDREATLSSLSRWFGIFFRKIFKKKSNDGQQESKEEKPKSTLGKIVSKAQTFVLSIRKWSLYICIASGVAFACLLALRVCLNVGFLAILSVALLFAVMLLLSDEWKVGLFMLALPFASIMKFTNGGISLLPVLLFPLLFSIIKGLIKGQISFPYIVWAAFAVFACYAFGITAVLGSGKELGDLVLYFAYFCLIALILIKLVSTGRLKESFNTILLCAQIGLVISILVGGLLFISPAMVENFQIIANTKFRVIAGFRRFSATFADSNIFGFYVLGIVGLSAVMRQKDCKYAFICLIGSLLLFLVGFLSVSYSYLVCALIFGIIYLIVSLIKMKGMEKKDMKMNLLPVLITAAAAVAGIGVLCPILISKVHWNEGLNEIFSDRFTIWGEYLSYFKECPLQLIFGGGINASRYYLPSQMVAHNILIDSIFDFGVAGVLTLTTFFVLFIINMDVKVKGKILLCSMMAVLVLYCMFTALHTSIYMLSLMPFILIAMLYDMKIVHPNGGEVYEDSNSGQPDSQD